MHFLTPEDLPPAPGAGERHIHIAGCGPTGASFAVNLAEARPSKDKVKIFVYERRAIPSPAGDRFTFDPAKRRHQVVTIQDVVARRVWRPSTMAAMLAPRGLHAEMPNAEQVQVERMWPGSVQMPLVDIEDNCMARLQAPDIQKFARIIPGALSREAFDDIVKRENTVLLIADGGGSVTRRWAFGDLAHRGECQPIHEVEDAAGLFFKLNEGQLSAAHAANTVLLTVSQTVFLGNFSVVQGRGFINIRLVKGLANRLRTADGEPATFGNPAYLQPKSNKGEKMLQDLLDANPLVAVFKAAAGFFKIPWGSFELACGIKISACRTQECMRRNMPVLAIGDAAFQVHFWPGRGLNSGLQTSCEAAQIVHQALEEGRSSGTLKLDYQKHQQKYARYVQQLSEVEVLERSRLPKLPTPSEVAGLCEHEARLILKRRATSNKRRLVPRYAQVTQTFQPNMRTVDESIDALPADQVKLLAASQEWPAQNWASPTDYLPEAGVLFPSENAPSSLGQKVNFGAGLACSTLWGYLKGVVTLH